MTILPTEVRPHQGYTWLLYQTGLLPPQDSPQARASPLQFHVSLRRRSLRGVNGQALLHRPMSWRQLPCGALSIHFDLMMFCVPFSLLQRVEIFSNLCYDTVLYRQTQSYNTDLYRVKRQLSMHSTKV